MRSIIFYKCHPDAIIPTREEGSVGYDVFSCGDYEVYPGQVVLVRTGLVAKVPWGYYFQLHIRSSTPIRNPGIVLANGVGVIDPSFNGPNDEICVELLNTKYGVPYQIKKGQKIAQLVLHEIVVANIQEGNYENLKGMKSRQGFGSSDQG